MGGGNKRSDASAALRKRLACGADQTCLGDLDTGVRDLFLGLEGVAAVVKRVALDCSDQQQCRRFP